MAQAGTTSDLRHFDHVLSADQFDRRSVDAVLDLAGALVDVRDQRLTSRIAATLFYEPSTRTRLSFESAMLRRGGSVLSTADAGAASSAVKGETLEDTIRIVSAYADTIVLRHPEVGAARRAAAVATVPIINAGDGAGEHPTQALLDLFCMRRDHGHIDGLNIVVCGDLRNGRTVHSLVRLLANYPAVHLTLVAPEAVQLDADITRVAERAGVRVERTDTLDMALPRADVVYQTRVQKERFDSADAYEAARRIRIDLETMRRVSANATVMHPLPRVDEISPDVDADPRAAYFRQAAGGVAVRMALLEMVLR